MNRGALLQLVESKYTNNQTPRVNIGDTVDVHCRIIEGQKERTQIFTGVVIARNGQGVNESITVRRIVANEGVERIFPIHSPKVAKIEIVRHGHVRRAKLYYLRERVGKKRRLRDRRRGLKHFVEADTAPAQSAEAPESPAPTPEPVEQAT